MVFLEKERGTTEFSICIEVNPSYPIDIYSHTLAKANERCI